jgi:hypothetical protein
MKWENPPLDALEYHVRRKERQAGEDQKKRVKLTQGFSHLGFWYLRVLTPRFWPRKTGPWSNKIKQMRKQNTEDTQYKRDTNDLRGSPSVGYVHQRNCQVLPLLLSSK